MTFPAFARMSPDDIKEQGEALRSLWNDPSTRMHEMQVHIYKVLVMETAPRYVAKPELRKLAESC